MDPLTNKPWEPLPARLLSMLVHNQHGWCFVSIPGCLFYLALRHHASTLPIPPPSMSFSLSLKKNEKDKELCTYTRLYTRWLRTGDCPKDLATVNPDGSVSFSLQTRAAIFVIRHAIHARPVINGVSTYNPVRQAKEALARFFAGEQHDHILVCAQNNWQWVLSIEPVEDLDRMWSGVWPDPRVVFMAPTPIVKGTEAGVIQPPKQTEKVVNQVEFGEWINEEDPKVNIPQPSFRPAIANMSAPNARLSDIPALTQAHHTVTWRPEVRLNTHLHNRALYQTYFKELARNVYSTTLSRLMIPPPLSSPPPPSLSRIPHSTTTKTIRLSRILVLKYRRGRRAAAALASVSPSAQPCVSVDTEAEAEVHRERALFISSTLACQETAQAIRWEKMCFLEKNGVDVPPAAMSRQLWVPAEQ